MFQTYNAQQTVERARNPSGEVGAGDYSLRHVHRLAARAVAGVALGAGQALNACPQRYISGEATGGYRLSVGAGDGGIRNEELGMRNEERLREAKLLLIHNS